MNVTKPVMEPPMQVIDRFVIALALPAGFFLGVGAYGFAQLLSLPGGILIGVLLLLGCVALFFTERILDIVFDSVFTGGVIDAIDPAGLCCTNGFQVGFPLSPDGLTLRAR